MNFDNFQMQKWISQTVKSLHHDLLLTKLNIYGYSYKSIKLISSFLSGRRYRTKINSAYSDWEDLWIDVPQGSGFGPFLFNIYKCDLFLLITKLNTANYADDMALMFESLWILK